jgi:hypothetical protein
MEMRERALMGWCGFETRMNKQTALLRWANNVSSAFLVLRQ